MSPEPRSVAVGSEPVRGARLLALEDRTPAEALAASTRERAYAEGLRAGHAQALAEGAGRLDQALEQLDARAQELERAAARTAAELALLIARELVGRELADGSQNVERIVRDVLAAAESGRGPCVVHLHPADAAALADVSFRSGTRIAPDPGVRRGDVHVETRLGLMVREVDEIFAAMATRLRQELAA